MNFEERERERERNPEWNTPNALAAKNLANQIHSLIENARVEEELPGIIAAIPEENRREIINSRFYSKQSFETLIGASCLYLAIDDVDEYINGRPRDRRIDATFARAAVRILLENGANPNIETPTDGGHRTIKELSILGIACYKGNLPIVTMLLNAGADVNFMRDSENVMTVLLDNRAGPTPEEKEKGAVDNVNEIIPLIYQHGFNICMTQVPESVRNNRTGLYEGDVVYHNVDMFERATKLLKFNSNKAQIALPLILRSCYRDLVKIPIRVRGETKELPRAIYKNDNLTGEMLTEMKRLYNSLIKQDQPAVPRKARVLTKAEEYAKINDDIPAMLADPLTAEDDLDENACKERGFIAAMKREDGYIYECVSKENLAYWNSGAKKTREAGIINLGFNAGQFKVNMPDWIKNQPIFKTISPANASALNIPEPKIFLIEEALDGKKNLLKAQFVGKNGEVVDAAKAEPSEEEVKNAWVRVPNEEKQDNSEPNFWYYNEITKKSQWNPPYEGAGGKRKTKKRSIKTSKKTRKIRKTIKNKRK
jgi:hypothetical protein